MGAHLEKYENLPIGVFALDVLKAYLVVSILVWTLSMTL